MFSSSHPSPEQFGIRRERAKSTQHLAVRGFLENKLGSASDCAVPDFRASFHIEST